MIIEKYGVQWNVTAKESGRDKQRRFCRIKEIVCASRNRGCL